MKIAISCDHTGIDMKNSIVKHLKDKHELIDLADGAPCKNYAIEGIKTAETVASGKASYGIVICGSGVGISIAANKVRGVRCALIYNEEIASLVKQHNNANVIAFGARFFRIDDVIRMIDIFLSSEYEGGRHEIRVDSIEDYESSCIDC